MAEMINGKTIFKGKDCILSSAVSLHSHAPEREVKDFREMEVHCLTKR